jgi:molybdopterin synthase catalytic subunit
MMIKIQTEDFNLADEVKALRSISGQTGAVVTFTGMVRDLSDGQRINQLFLEHYPGMTEKSITAIIDEAGSRWSLLGVRVIHRVGLLSATDQIVLVAVSSMHRNNAFEACEFIMDYLKTRAPFWKKEQSADGEQWLVTKESDVKAADRWVE